MFFDRTLKVRAQNSQEGVFIVICSQEVMRGRKGKKGDTEGMQ